METLFGSILILWGLVMVLVPEIPFRLQYIELKGAELSDGGRILIRVLGGVVVFVGFGVLGS